MPLLAYCTLDADAQVEIPIEGVQSAPISSCREAKLQCLVSQFSSSNLAVSRSVRESAIIFNRVLQALLEQVTIVPFRFPTIVSNEEEISFYLRDHEGSLLSDLTRFNGMVQMEISIQLAARSSAGSLKSGKSFLRAKQVQLEVIGKMLSDLKRSLTPYTEGWQTRESAGRARSYVLVNRKMIRDFQEAAKAIVLPEEGKVRITGPWPVSEFLTSHE